jgi:ribosomal protein L3 glutamine methyltransferase
MGARKGPVKPRQGRPAAPTTVGEWLAHAEALYARHRVALGQIAGSAHDEALYLILSALGLPLDSKPAVLKRRLTEEERQRLTGIFQSRTAGRVPAAYLTREAWLGGLRFYVDERVIIPRSYFVELLPEQLPHWLPAGRPVRRVADVCTGSGCLAVLLARRFPGATVDAFELSPEALAVARFNVAAHRLASRVRLFHSDVLEAAPRGKYDLIVSNPPYVPSRELRRLPEEFRREPAMALDGGADGFDVIRRLLRQSRDRLAPHGAVAIEVGGLKAAMEKTFRELEPHWLHTEDAEDCVCVVQAARLRRWRG